jgi:hypothetical protein
MPTFTTRLEFVSGKTLELGKKWFDSDEFPVGLIIERPELSVQLPSAPQQPGQEEDDDGPVERTPAHYEVWLLPDPLRDALFRFYFQVSAVVKGLSKQTPTYDEIKTEAGKIKTQNIVCRRIPASSSHVAFTEDVVGMVDAIGIIHEYFADKIDMPDDGEDLPEIAPRPQLGSANGPAGARAE